MANILDVPKRPFKRTIQIQIYKLISFDEKAFQFGQQIVILLRSKEKEKKTPIACTYYVYYVAQHGNDDTLLRFDATLRICYVLVVVVVVAVYTLGQKALSAFSTDSWVIWAEQHVP